ncbi:MAG: hypothetical protein J6A21_09865, partial [Lentisphaeria bacterium]|nr:hypothetical protein [Lentisphaeria bacterium]
MRNTASFLVFSLFFLVFFPLSGGELEVRTAPDGFYDCRIGTIYSNAPSLLSFYSYAKGKAFSAKEVKFFITLPESFRVTHFAVTRRAKKIASARQEKLSGGKVRWELPCGDLNFSAVYAVLGPYSVLPWTPACFLVFVQPSGKVPPDFSAEWKITGQDLAEISGEMKLKTMPAPVLKKAPKGISVHSSTGMWGDNAAGSGGGWSRETFLGMVKTLKNAGVTVLEETGGMWMPEALVPGKELREMGFTLEYMGAFNYPQREEKEKMRAAGCPVREEDMMVDLLGRRVENHRQQKGNAYIYCFTSMAEKDSPVRKFIRARFESLIQRGFRLFYEDTEPRAYAFCYCPKCRKKFAEEENLPEKEILALSGPELIRKYPVKWYKFQCRSFARVFGVLNNELAGRCRIGSDSTLGVGKFHIPAFRSAGVVNWAEDPRFADEFLAYHDADTLGGGLASIFEAKLFFQRYDDGTPMLKKPVVVRATSFQYVHTWSPFSVLGRMDAAKKKGMRGLGLDERRTYNKLSVANVIALGASGVRVYQDYCHADAASLTGVVEGLSFAAAFDGLYSFAFRDLAGEKALKIYDATKEESPRRAKEKNTLLGEPYGKHADTFGVIQSTLHRKEGKLLISLFNWDVFQNKKLRLVLPPGTEKGLILHIATDREQYSLPGTFSGKEISFELPAGGVAGLLLSPERVSPADGTKKLPSFTGGTLVKTYEAGNTDAG